MFRWRRRKTPNNAQQKKLLIPEHFICPISLDLMKDPVTLSSGITYDRESIEIWLQNGNFTCPVTNQILRSFDQITNHSLRKMIQEWCVENQNHGVERIPTPRIPVTSDEVMETLSEIMDSQARLDKVACLNSVLKIRKWWTESDRNRMCIVSNGTAGVVAAAFDAFASDSFEKNSTLLEEMLSVMNLMFPLDRDSELQFGCFECLVWFLKCKDISISAKQNSMNVLKELLSCNNQQYGERLSAIDGINELLFKFIKDPISPSIKKSSLYLIFHMISSSDNLKSQFAEMGLVPLLLDTIVESEKPLCEISLGVLDKLCDSKQGRENAYNNALTMPVLVKKILRISELTTDYSVSAIWKLSKLEEKYEERILIEALQVGAFQKLLLLIQVGCGDQTKEKATELLKVMNPYRAGLECIETVDFKSLNRSF